MKVLERIALVVFSIIVLILAVVSCLLVFQVISTADIANFIASYIKDENVARAVVIVSVICALLAIKSLFFPSKRRKKEEIKTGVLLENQDGRLLISKETIENLITSIVKSFHDAVDSQTRVFLDAENNITVFISLLVNKEAVIKELSSNIQTRIKDTVKRNTGLDVMQVNINVKNIDENEHTETTTQRLNIPQKENSVKDENKKNNIKTDETAESKTNVDTTVFTENSNVLKNEMNAKVEDIAGNSSITYANIHTQNDGSAITDNKNEYVEARNITNQIVGILSGPNGDNLEVYGTHENIENKTEETTINN